MSTIEPATGIIMTRRGREPVSDLEHNDAAADYAQHIPVTAIAAILGVGGC